ncbi:zinc finger protein OZF-like isoform X1 [Periplaneta americana]|uniref:zinc finger protein OZF-like isoform X1 n=3 Tax=Periplaneta americana TaxID=6978 RepID=UPI0037E71D2B
MSAHARCVLQLLKSQQYTRGAHVWKMEQDHKVLRIKQEEALASTTFTTVKHEHQFIDDDVNMCIESDAASRTDSVLHMKQEEPPVQNSYRDEEQVLALKKEFKEEVTIDDHEVLQSSTATSAEYSSPQSVPNRIALSAVPYNEENRNDLSRIFKVDKNFLALSNCYINNGDSERRQNPSSAVHTKEKPFTCETCYKGFGKKCHLVRHRMIHTAERPFSCDICRKTFRYLQYMAVHIRTHTGEKPFTCDICGKGCTNRGALKLHISCHDGNKRLTCGVCKKGFNTKTSLGIHSRVHTGEKPYSCDECGKKFRQRIHLDVHQRSHADDKPFMCDDCGRGFSQRGGLVSHVRTHAVERPFTCNFCTKAFRSKRDLVVHVRIHTGEKPYTCGYCGHGYAQKSNLIRHIESHIRRGHRLKYTYM